MTLFITAFIPSSILAVAAASAGAVSIYGGILALVLCTEMTMIGGISLFVTTASVFLFTVACSKFAGRKADPYHLRKKHGKRGAERIFCNIGIAGIMCLIFGITGDRIFLISCYAALSESLSDSVASKIGPLTNGKTIDMCTLRPADMGISGGISLLGTLAAFTGALMTGLIYFAFNRDLNGLFLISLCGFLGCMFDSFLGSSLQVKYICPECGKLTECSHHCSSDTVYYKGLKLLNNDLVNLTSNFVSSLLVVLIMVI